MSDSETIRELAENTKLVGNAVSTFARDFLTARLADWKDRTIAAKPDRAAIPSQLETLIEPLATARPEENPVRELVQFFEVIRRWQQLTSDWIPFLPEFISLSPQSVEDIAELGLKIDDVTRSQIECRQMMGTAFPFDCTETKGLRRAVSRITISPIRENELSAFLEVAGEWLSEAARVLVWCSAVTKSNPVFASGMFPQDLAKRIGCSAPTLVKYARAAGIEIADQGDRSRTYSKAECVAICKQFLKDEHVRPTNHQKNATKLLSELNGA